MLLLPNDSQSSGSASEGEVPRKKMGWGGARTALTDQLRSTEPLLQSMRFKF